VAIGGALFAPVRGDGVEEVVDPVHGVIELGGVGAGGGEADEGLGVEAVAEVEEFVGAEAVVVGGVSPDGVEVEFAIGGGTDAVGPFVDGGEGAAGPADEGGVELLEGVEEVWAEFAVGAGVGGHEGDEVDGEGFCAGVEDFEGAVGVGEGAGEFEGDFLPAGLCGDEGEIGDEGAFGIAEAEGEVGGFGLIGGVGEEEPEGAVVFFVLLEIDAVLADAGGAGEADGLLAVFEGDFDELGGAGAGEGVPEVGEVCAFEALALDLFGVEAIDDGVVEVFEELAVEALVDFAGGVVGVDEEDGDAGGGGSGEEGGCGESEEEECGEKFHGGPRVRFGVAGMVMGGRVVVTG